MTIESVPLRDRMIFAAVNAAVYARHPGLVLRFRRLLGRWPQPALPRDYWEKILWRKLFDHDPVHTRLSDKLELKSWLAEAFPMVRTAPVLWSGNRVEDLPYDDLCGRPIVLKTNNGSGRNIFLADKTAEDWPGVSAQLERWMSNGYGRHNGEWGYYGVEAKLFAETEMAARESDPLLDCCFYCAAGQIINCAVTTGEKTESERVGFFDRQGRLMSGTSVRRAAPERRLPPNFTLPTGYETAARFAEAITRNLDFVRLDFLVRGEDVSALECTWYPEAGYTCYTDPSIPAAYHQAWDVGRSWFMTTAQRGALKIYQQALRRSQGMRSGFVQTQ